MEKDYSKIPKISIFPTIGSAVLRVDDKLVVFAPLYLLGKHGSKSQQVSSKFLRLNRAVQLLNIFSKFLSSAVLKGVRVNLKELDVGVVCGTNNLIKVSSHVAKILPEEDVRGNMVKVLYTTKDKIPFTNLMNFVLVKFDPRFGQGVEDLFKKKYGGNISFDDFKGVYAILTMFPGDYAPPFDKKHFWKHHALLKEI